jgi:hypothetical protein
MTLRGRRAWPVALWVAVAVTLWLLLPSAAWSLETQLCGIKLGDHGTHLMDVHGPPDMIAPGSG